MPDEAPPTTAQVARVVQTAPATLRRWIARGLIPQYDGAWTPTAIAHARLVARMRGRGHSLDEIREAGEAGRLAFGYLEEIFPPLDRLRTLEEAADETGLEPALVERILTTMGLPAGAADRLAEDDVELLRHSAAVLAAGFPLVAFLQLVRVYGQAIAQLADAEVRLFDLYVHEPLMRERVPGTVMAEQMEHLARDLLPLASPIMELLHNRQLAHFVDRDVIAHMERHLGEDAPSGLGRLRVAMAFADLAGYTRLTEEVGDEHAVDVVERFVADVEHTLPEGARVIKTIGDEAMIVGSDPAALVDWAVGFQHLHRSRPRARIGVHYGEVLYRDGDYYGREVNLAARVSARAAGGEVLVTQPIVEASGTHLEFEHAGDVRLKGFSQAAELYVARQAAIT